MVPLAGSAERERNLVQDYRRLVAVLAARGARLGSRDPESAAQEAVRRSLENPKSQRAVEFYLNEDPPTGGAPEWPLDQLLAWLYGVLQFVVREEQSRAAFLREVPAKTLIDAVDSAAGPLDNMLDRETRAIVQECFATLDHEYRDVLTMRLDGLKYGEIARRTGANENTVATRVSRGVRALSAKIRKRLEARHE
jgi:RNA polymerase sigma factor (sigma-70 family)